MLPGKYRAATLIALERCHGNTDGSCQVREYWIYEPGEVFEVPETVNEFFYRIQPDPETGEPSGKAECLA